MEVEQKKKAWYQLAGVSINLGNMWGKLVFVIVLLIVWFILSVTATTVAKDNAYQRVKHVDLKGQNFCELQDKEAYEVPLVYKDWDKLTFELRCK